MSIRRAFLAVLIGPLLVAGAVAQPNGQGPRAAGVICNDRDKSAGESPGQEGGRKKLEQIVSATRARTAALINRDRDALRSLLAADFVYTNASGRLFTRDTYIENYALDGSVVWASQTLSDVCVRFAGDVAVLTAVTHDVAKFGDYSLNTRFRTTQIYRQSGGKWTYVAGHTSNLE